MDFFWSSESCFGTRACRVSATLLGRRRLYVGPGMVASPVRPFFSAKDLDSDGMAGFFDRYLNCTCCSQLG